MTLKQAIRNRDAAETRLRHAQAELDQAIQAEREAGRTIPELMKLTGLSYRGVYLALNRNQKEN